MVTHPTSDFDLSMRPMRLISNSVLDNLNISLFVQFHHTASSQFHDFYSFDIVCDELCSGFSEAVRCQLTLLPCIGAPKTGENSPTFTLTPVNIRLRPDFETSLLVTSRTEIIEGCKFLNSEGNITKLSHRRRPKSLFLDSRFVQKLHIFVQFFSFSTPKSSLLHPEPIKSCPLGSFNPMTSILLN